MGVKKKWIYNFGAIAHEVKSLLTLKVEISAFLTYHHFVRIWVNPENILHFLLVLCILCLSNSWFSEHVLVFGTRNKFWICKNQDMFDLCRHQTWTELHQRLTEEPMNRNWILAYLKKKAWVSAVLLNAAFFPRARQERRSFFQKRTQSEHR